MVIIVCFLINYLLLVSFFTHLKSLINELKSAGGKVTEREKLDYMLKTLPDSQSYIVDLVDALQESNRTCKFVKSKISVGNQRSK